MSNFKRFMSNHYWKITAGVSAVCGICAILNVMSGEYKEALFWACLTISDLELAIYQQREM